jgi:hypothetical protein
MGSRASEPISYAVARISRPLATGLAILAGIVRLLPHPWNFTPLGALGLYGGARLRSWQAFALPLVVLAVTDLVLWVLLDNHPFDPFVYGSFLIYVLLGRLLSRTQSPWRIGLASLVGSLQFFIITNFGVWLTGLGKPYATYPGSLEGLVACYLAAIPFYGKDVAPPLGFLGNTILGDLAFTALLFAGHALLARWAFPAERVRVTPDKPQP